MFYLYVSRYGNLYFRWPYLFKTCNAAVVAVDVDVVAVVVVVVAAVARSESV